MIFLKYKNIHLKNYHSSCFYNPCHGARPVTGSDRNHNVTRLVRFSLRYTFSDNWKSKSNRNILQFIFIFLYIFTIICCISLFIIPDSIFSFDCLIQTNCLIQVLALTYLLRHLWFQPAVCISFSSWNYARSGQGFVFFHPPVFSAVPGTRPWIPVQLGCMQRCRNHGGDSFRNTEIKSAGKKEPDSALRKK